VTKYGGHCEVVFVSPKQHQKAPQNYGVASGLRPSQRQEGEVTAGSQFRLRSSLT